MQAEHPWRLVASLAVSLVGSAIVLMAWLPVARGLWHLATFEQTRGINPMGFSLDILVGVLAGLLIGAPLSLIALRFSQRPLAVAAIVLMQLASLLAISSPILFLAFVWARGIEVNG